jgi:hypothetical protein
VNGLVEGDRVEAVRFALDEGLRIWPIFENGRPSNNWRVVQVNGQRDEDVTELYRGGSSRECQLQYPDATFGINDNETVPPGTQGTVRLVTSGQVSVDWDNGSHLSFVARDICHKL